MIPEEIWVEWDRLEEKGIRLVKKQSGIIDPTQPDDLVLEIANGVTAMRDPAWKEPEIADPAFIADLKMGIYRLSLDVKHLQRVLEQREKESVVP